MSNYTIQAGNNQQSQNQLLQDIVELDISST